MGIGVVRCLGLGILGTLRAEKALGGVGIVCTCQGREGRRTGRWEVRGGESASELFIMRKNRNDTSDRDGSMPLIAAFYMLRSTDCAEGT